MRLRSFFFFNDTATTEIYTLSLHDALPIFRVRGEDTPFVSRGGEKLAGALEAFGIDVAGRTVLDVGASTGDRKSTRLNSSHGYISYAVFCLKKKKHTNLSIHRPTYSYASTS